MKHTNVIKPRNPDEWRILTAASKTFLEKGFTATTMTDLVAATGLNRATLYSGYGSKHQIYIMSMEFLRTEMRSEWESVLTLEPSPTRRLSSILTALIDTAPHLTDGDFYTRAALELGDDPATAQRIIEFWQQLHTDVSELCKRAQVSGQLAEHADPDSIAAMVVSLIQGVYVNRSIDAAQQLNLDSKPGSASRGLVELLES
ncbi:TetR/AcrR family transcriptional regulator [Haloglycomyces albus]|uniref:TetR/AcrR family transcriptional regulator n=1 Tax=Haloglycomyces albus TaxID=526067 RepID=UPI00046D1E17|nr:TetR/AcrR family transcriptional regulator [Haloglycomyces albus]